MNPQPHSIADLPTEMRQEVLRSFECPLDCDQYDQSIYMVSDCPFGHLHSNSTKGALRKIPSYLCVDHLLNRCNTNVPHSTDSNGLVRCNTSDKFHASFEELVDLNYFCEKIAASALAVPFVDASSSQQVQANPTPAQRGTRGSRGRRSTLGRKRPKPEEETPKRAIANECSICFGNVCPGTDQFGLLDKCAHHFCASCIIDWFVQPKSKRTCPICRIRSTRILVWPKSSLTKQEKKKIFELCKKAAKASKT